ncbi:MULTISPECIES: hypothetical protein [unclassified Streptomyces]|uniref:hypothetical protein n=1 Tax=unclassified Streptomyces TaxID=2593676 RepID=UPI0036E16CFC
MFVLFLVLVVVLFGLGFLNPLWWVAAAVLVFGVTRHARDGGAGRSRGGGSALGGYRDYEDYREYRDHRARQDRWERRYSRQNRGRWGREDGRGHEHRG